MQQAQSKQAQNQIQQKAQDPIIQMQQQELQIKMQELQLKQQKQQIDAVAKADQLKLDEARIEAQKEIAAMQVSANAAAARDKLDKNMQAEGMRMGLDVAKSKAQLAVQQAAQRAAQGTGNEQKNRGNK